VGPVRMNPERWQRIATICDAALDVADSERDTFLAEACAGDATLRQEVQTLLAHDQDISPLDQPVWVADNLLVQPATLAIGETIGIYRIEGILGAGGMGQVYRAKDTKLGRSVALKVLPDVLARDPERRARFQREAQVLAALNHPHIGAIHGFEDSGRIHALVLELVEGPTLADVLARDVLSAPQGEGRSLPLDEAIGIARQIVDALEVAHEQGIVHRDLKPANIKVRTDGTVKVLDFGLARLVQTEGDAPTDIGESPAITSPAMTIAGTILGTAAYMSPEQAKGRPADARSDIWAFGCVFYEMLTGTRPFVGEDVADTLAAVLRADPDWSALPSTTPLSIRRLLERCLQKDRRRRLAAIADVRFHFDEAVAPERVAAQPTSRTPWIAAVAVATVTLIALTAFALLRPTDAVVPIEPVQFTVGTPANTTFGGPLSGGTGNSQQLAISPDGRTLVFVAGAPGRYQLWLRPVGSLVSTPIPGTEDATFPFWSPDSRAIAFFTYDKLKKVQTTGGPPVALCDVVAGKGGSWSRDNVILFADLATSTLRRISADGGRPLDVTRPEADRNIMGHRWPHFLPDGRHFLYTTVSGACCPPIQAAVVRVASLDAPEAATTLFQAESSAFFSSGHVFFLRDQTLMAQAFELATRQLKGSAFAVAERVSSEGSRYLSASASDQGTLVFGQGGVPTVQRMTWFNRMGDTLGVLGDPTTYHSLALSPNEKQVAVARAFGGSADIDLWLFDAVTGNATHLTNTAGLEGSPVWSPDGTRIAYQSQHGGKSSLRLIKIDGSGDALLFESSDTVSPTSWSRTGDVLAFTRTGASGASDIWALPMSGDRTPFPVVQTSFDETLGAFSPDGHWIAFTSNESGRPRIFVRAFPTPGVTHPISPGEGRIPMWRGDGKELFYLSQGRLMAVPIDLTGDGIRPGRPQPLFVVGAPGFSPTNTYAVTADGQRFLSNARPQQPTAEPLTVVINWLAALHPTSQ
jgi:serine/threonine protein kinase/Tol biopolymer transport system component